MAVNHMLCEGLVMVQEQRHPKFILDSLEVFGAQQMVSETRTQGAPLPRAA
jgi:hypothetical protein